MTVTVLGHVCIDKNVSEGTTYISAGSPAMFIDKVYKKFPDVLTNIIAPYGSDFLTYTHSINILPKKSTSDFTLIYENKSQGNVRTQKALNREYANPLYLSAELQSELAKSDVIFLAPLMPNFSSGYATNLMKHVKPGVLKILIPQGYYRDFDSDDNVIERDFIEAEELIPLFDFVIVSNQDHKAMRTIAQTWAQNTQVVMTLGDHGAEYLYKDESLVESVEPVKSEDIIDSVGSGDIFSASFGYKYFLTKDIKKSLKFANKIARQCLFYPVNNLQFVLPQT